MDSNLASKTQAKQNIERLLKRGYNINIMYLYNDPLKCFKYATEREFVTHRWVAKDVFTTRNRGNILNFNDQFMEEAIARINELQNVIKERSYKIDGAKEYIEKQVELFEKNETLRNQAKYLQKEGEK